MRTFFYPKLGQSAEKQKKDEYECHQWAVQQTGVDLDLAIRGNGFASGASTTSVCLSSNSKMRSDAAAACCRLALTRLNFFAGPFGLLRVVTNIDEVTLQEMSSTLSRAGNTMTALLGSIAAMPAFAASAARRSPCIA